MREELDEGDVPNEPTPASPAAFPTSFSSPEPAPSTPATSINSRPHIFENGYQVSLDRQHWWDGGMWVPGSPPGKEPLASSDNSSTDKSAPLNTTVQAMIAIGGLILFAGFAFSVCQSMPSSTFPAP